MFVILHQNNSEHMLAGMDISFPNGSITTSDVQES